MLDETAASVQSETEPLAAPQRAHHTPARFLWVRTAPGVSAFNLASFYYATFITITAYTFVNVAQKLVLSELLGVPDEDIGRSTGDLGFYNELVIIVCVPLWGVASDKAGRRLVYFLGFVFIAIGFFLSSYARSYGELVAYRLIYAVGAAAAAAMLSAVLADYSTYEDKGRASGFMGFFSGCGALLAAFVLIQIPEWLSARGTAAAIHGAYITSASVVLASALFLLVGLQGKTKTQQQNAHATSISLLRDGLHAAWMDPQLALAFAAGFVARGDAVVLTTFLSLWVQDYMKEQGADSEEASSKAGIVTGIAQTCALIFSLVAGYLGSRLKSAVPMIIVAAIAAVGYGAICFVDDPTGVPGIFCACIVGIGEIGVIVIAQSLVSRRAPTQIRGAVGGLVGLCGSVGILVCSKIGGILYDEWSPAGPFLLFAIFNLLLLLGAIGVYWHERARGLLLDVPADHLKDEETYEKLLQDGKQSEDEASALLSAGARAL